MHLQKPYNVFNTEQPLYEKMQTNQTSTSSYSNQSSQYSPYNNRYPEEEPTFQEENQRNINQYKNYILAKQKLTELNSHNYMNYIINQRKTNRARSPFFSRSESITSPLSQTVNEQASYQNPLNEQFIKQYNKSRRNEITNPDLYYKQSNQDYLRYREQERKYLNSNYELMIKNGNYKKKLDVNPYNKNSSTTSLGESKLIHNTILNPIPNYSYNKYFDEDYNRHGKNRSSSSFLS